MDGDPERPLSKRKQKSLERQQEFQRRKRLKLRWQHVLHKFARAWRHQRMWNVHNAWFATRSASADAAEPVPAHEIERMDENRGSKRAAEPAEQGAVEAQPSQHASESAPQSGSGLNPTAQAFVPGLLMTEVEHA